MMELGVEGMMLSPGYSYDKAPDQKHFLGRARTRRLFRSILSNRKKSWKFNQSTLFLEFLMGKQHYKCTPWGMPTYNVFGWQKPCYLLQDGYADTFQELLDSTEWQNYGTESGNPKCANCMVHSGYEASAVDHTFSGLGGLVGDDQVDARGQLRRRRRAANAQRAGEAGARVQSAGANQLDRLRDGRDARVSAPSHSDHDAPTSAAANPLQTQRLIPNNSKSQPERRGKTSKAGCPNSPPTPIFAPRSKKRSSIAAT